MIVFSDISEKIRRDRINKLNNYKDEMLSLMSHYIKTPLNAMNLYCQSVKLKIKDQNCIKDVIEIEKNGEFLRGMI